MCCVFGVCYQLQTTWGDSHIMQKLILPSDFLFFSFPFIHWKTSLSKCERFYCQAVEFNFFDGIQFANFYNMNEVCIVCVCWTSLYCQHPYVFALSSDELLKLISLGFERLFVNINFFNRTFQYCLAFERLCGFQKVD